MTPPSETRRGGTIVRTLPSLAQTIDVETPELVVLSYTIAGVGSRALAALIDSLICIATIVLIMIGLAISSTRRGVSATPGVFDAWAAAVFVLAIFCVIWGYYVL